MFPCAFVCSFIQHLKPSINIQHVAQNITVKSSLYKRQGIKKHAYILIFVLPQWPLAASLYHQTARIGNETSSEKQGININ